MIVKYNSWGGVREESKVIEYFADKWCTDNGYPIQKRRWVYKGTWTQIEKEKNE